MRFIRAEAPAGWVRPAPTDDAPADVPPIAPIMPSSLPTVEAGPKAKAVEPAKIDFKNDPLIKQALDIFKGQIVEIRA